MIEMFSIKANIVSGLLNYNILQQVVLRFENARLILIIRKLQDSHYLYNGDQVPPQLPSQSDFL